jgi:hypothetical protein
VVQLLAQQEKNAMSDAPSVCLCCGWVLAMCGMLSRASSSGIPPGINGSTIKAWQALFEQKSTGMGQFSNQCLLEGHIASGTRS